MIKFFRQIRQNLLGKGETIKYFKYAIGEIVLVVIGILIALAISKWNKNINDRGIEEDLIIELYKGLQTDKTLLVLELNETNNAIRKLKILNGLLKTTIQQDSDSLNYLFGTVYGIRHLRLNLALYEDLKAIGLGIVKNAALRSQIIKVFEEHYVNIGEIYMMEQSINEVNRPYYLSNFGSIEFSQYANPVNIENLWNDVYYKNIVHYRIVTLEYNQKTIYEKAIKDIEKLLEMVDERQIDFN